MVKIRLMRLGSKNRKFYRIVATDESQKLVGKPSEYLGYWKPDKKDLRIDKVKFDAWVNKGAKVSDAVAKILSK